MMQLSNDQLNNLPKEALIIITSSLQEQLALMQEQLDKANAQLDKANVPRPKVSVRLILMDFQHEYSITGLVMKSLPRIP